MDTKDLYIDLLKKALMHSPWIEMESRESSATRWLKKVAPSIFGRTRGTAAERREGRVWPQFAHTMIGEARMNNLRHCVEQTIREGVPGDLIETGVWRGGACIFMRGILKANGITDKTVWVADSFQGLPPPDADKAPADINDKHHTYSDLVVGLEDVQKNFSSFDLLDDQVRFLKGWFKDTLETAPIPSLSVCRLDGDMYESTMDALTALYPKLSPGGFLIVDDYGAVPGCKKAIHDYREAHSIGEEIRTIDWSGIYWRKSA